MLIIRFSHRVGFCFVVMIHGKQVKRQPQHFKGEKYALSALWNDVFVGRSASAAYLIFLSIVSSIFNGGMKNVDIVLWIFSELQALKVNDVALPRYGTWVDEFQCSNCKFLFLLGWNMCEGFFTWLIASLFSYPLSLITHFLLINWGLDWYSVGVKHMAGGRGRPLKGPVQLADGMEECENDAGLFYFCVLLDWFI